MAGDYPALHRLERALDWLTGQPDTSAFMRIQGSVNIVGGGAGGTAMSDEGTFTTGGTSVTPMGALSMSLGAQSAASLGYDRIGAPKMSGQRILFTSIATPSGGDVMDNANTAVRVNVVAGGAGGGVANITVRGTANSTDYHVGGASTAAGAWPNQDGAAWLPVMFPSGFYPTINTVGGGGFASVGVYGSVSVTGSVNVTQGTLPLPVVGSVNITGSINPVGVFGSVNVLGTTTLGAIATVNLGLGTVNVGNIPAVTVGSVPIVGAAVQGTGLTTYRVGYASTNAGAWPNQDGAAWLPVMFPSGFYPTTNVAGNVTVTGSVNITGSINPVGVFGSLGALVGSVNITGSINPVGIFGSVNAVGSVNVTGSLLAAVITGAGSLPVTVASLMYADSTNSALRVNVVAGGAGGGVANITVVGTANTAFHVGQASQNTNVAWPQMPNVDGAAWLPVAFPSGMYPTVNIAGIGADTVNSALRVNVVAGGAGGGVANLTVRGTGNTDYHVGYASNNLGAWPNIDGGAWMPVMFPSGFYPTTNVAGNVGVFGSLGALTGSVNITGSINPVGVFGSVQVVGSVNITGSLNPVGIFGSVSAIGSVNITGSLNPVGIFGSANANLLVTGTGNTAYRVGYASNNLSAWPNYDGGAWLPVFFPSGFYPTLNITGSVGVAGNVGVFGSVTGIQTVNMGGIATVNLGLGTVNIGNVPAVDTRGSLVPTVWQIAFAASGYSAISIASTSANVKTKLYAIHITSENSAVMSFQCPSGTFLTGSIRIPGAAGWNMSSLLGNPLLVGAANATFYLHIIGSQNVGGFAAGWIEP